MLRVRGFLNRLISVHLLLFSLSAWASGPVGGAIQGTLYQPGGGPVTSSNVTFKVQVLDKSATCVLYEEVHTGLDLSGTNGDFSFNLGSGASKVNNVDGSALLKSNIFRNDVNVGASASCPGGVTVAAGDERLIRVMYDVAGGTSYSTLSPDMKALGSPYSVVAETLQGKSSSDFVQVLNDATHVLTQSNLENVFSSTNYPRLQSLLSGTASVDFNNQKLINVANPTSAQDAATKNYSDTSFGGKTLDMTGVGAASGDKFVMYWDQSSQKWVAGLPNDASKLPLAGGTMTGPIAMGAQNITNIGHMTMAAKRTLGLGSFTDTEEATLIATPLTAADAGKFWYNSDHGVLKVWSGSAAVAQAYTNGSGQIPASQLPSTVVLDGGNAATSAMNIGNNGNFALNLRTNSTTAVTIDNAGKVGIGTTTPSAVFSVAGSSSDKAYFFYDNGQVPAGTDGASLYVYRRAAAGDKYIRLYNYQGNWGSVIDSNNSIFQTATGSIYLRPTLNNYLEGTSTSIGASWSVNNPPVYHYGYITEAATAKYTKWQVNDATNNYELSRQDSNIGYLDLQMPTIFSGGNVGIGSSTPIASLDIVRNDTHTSGPGFGTSTVTNYQPATNPAVGTSINNNYTYLNTLSTANLSNVTSFAGNYTNQHLGGSNLAAQYGLQAATVHGGTSTVALAQGIQAFATNSNTGTITSAAAIAASVTNSGGGTITTGYGLQIGNIEASTKYGLYQSDTTAKNYFGGKVGIGTTTNVTGTSLDITGTGAANSSIIIPRDTTAARPTTGVNGMMRYNSSIDQFEGYAGGAWVSFASTGGTSSGQSASGALTYTSNSDSSGNDGGFTFQSGGSNLMTINNAGDVNITSTTTSTNGNTGALTVAGGLGVNGPANFNSTLTAGQITSGGSTISPYTATSGLIASPTQMSNQPYINVLNNSSTDSSGAFYGMQAKNTAGTIQRAYMGVYSNTAGSTPTVVIGQQTGAGAYSERMRIDANGYVGIGTTVPTSLLHTSDSSAQTTSYTGILHNVTTTSSTASVNKIGMDIESTGTWNGAGANNIGLKVNVSGAASSASNLAATFTGGGMLLTNSPTVGRVLNSTVLEVSNSASATYSSSSVSSQNPAIQALFMNGNFINNNSSLLGFFTRNASTNQYTYIGGMSGTVDYAPSLVFGHSTGASSYSETMRIDASGNVGIGSTSPTAALDVNGAINVKGLNGINFPSTDSNAGGSIAIGPSALAQQGSLASAAYGNIAIGYQSMGGAGMTASALSNVAIGYQTMTGTMGSNQNVVVGYQAMKNDSSTSNYNVVVGYQAMLNGTNSTWMTALGAGALKNGGNSAYSTAVGTESVGGAGGGGFYTTALGHRSGFSISHAAAGNTVIGSAAGQGISSGQYNTLLGYATGGTLNSGSGNILIGNQVDVPSASTANFLNIGNLVFATGLNGTLAAPAGMVGIGTTVPTQQLDVAGFIRTRSGIVFPDGTIQTTNGSAGMGMTSTTDVSFAADTDADTTGAISMSTGGVTRMTILNNGRVGIGSSSPASALDVNGAISVNGVNAISYPTNDTTVNGTVAIGPQALSSLSGSTAVSSTAVGYQALKSLTTGYQATAVGYQALMSQTTNYTGTALGYQAARLFTTAAQSYASPTAIGAGALASLTTGGWNTAVGRQALVSVSTGQNNAALGDAAAQGKNGASSSNTAIGYAALYSPVGSASNFNTAIGDNTLYNNSSGNSNTALGHMAGFDSTTGQQNIFVGSFPTTGVGITTGSSNILIGYDVRPASQTATGQMNIGNLIYGTGLGTGTTAATGGVGIGTNAPTAGTILDVNGTGTTQSAMVVPRDSTANRPAGVAGMIRYNTSLSTIEWYNGTGWTNAPAITSPTFSTNVSISGSTATPYVSIDGSNAMPIAANAGLNMNNTTTADGTGSFIKFGTSNTGAVSQKALIGAISNTAGNTPTIVIGQQTGGSTYAERMRIDASGNVGIGTNNPSFTLDVNGNARATGSVASWSDIRAKKNIVEIPDALNKVQQLRGVTFDWRQDEFPGKKFKDGRDMGVIAQDVEKVFPEAVQTAPDGYKSVAYAELVAPLIQAIKELYAQWFNDSTELHREIDQLKLQNAELMKRLETLERNQRAPASAK